MGISLKNNTLSALAFEIPASKYLPEIAVIRDARLSKVKDASGKITDKVDCTRYDCVNPDTYEMFTIKVPGAEPVITKEDLESSTAPIFIEIPMEDVVIRPYSIEYGKANVSIIAPYVTLVKK